MAHRSMNLFHDPLVVKLYKRQLATKCLSFVQFGLSFSVMNIFANT